MAKRTRFANRVGELQQVGLPRVRAEAVEHDHLGVPLALHPEDADAGALLDQMESTQSFRTRLLEEFVPRGKQETIAAVAVDALPA